jgi:hypothetical protein
MPDEDQLSHASHHRAAGCLAITLAGITLAGTRCLGTIELGEPDLHLKVDEVLAEGSSEFTILPTDAWPMKLPDQRRAEQVLRDDPGRDPGVGGELKVLADIASGVYSLAEFSRADVAAAAWVVERYSGLRAKP